MITIMIKQVPALLRYHCSSAKRPFNLAISWNNLKVFDSVAVTLCGVRGPAVELRI